MKVWHVQVTRHGETSDKYVEAETKQKAHLVTYREDISLLWRDILVIGEAQ